MATLQTQPKAVSPLRGLDGPRRFRDADRDRGRRRRAGGGRRPAARDERSSRRSGGLRPANGRLDHRGGRGGTRLDQAASGQSDRPVPAGVRAGRGGDLAPGRAQRSAAQPRRAGRAGVLPPGLRARVRVPGGQADRDSGTADPRRDVALLRGRVRPVDVLLARRGGWRAAGRLYRGLSRERLDDRRPAEARRELRHRPGVGGDRHPDGDDRLPRRAHGAGEPAATADVGCRSTRSRCSSPSRRWRSTGSPPACFISTAIPCRTPAGRLPSGVPRWPTGCCSRSCRPASSRAARSSA